MQIFLVQPDTEFNPNEFIKVKFNGKDLRTYLNGTVIDLQPAKAGECFYVQPNGQKKKPTVTKAILPETRGKRIAWALSFIGEKKLADSYEDFFKKFAALQHSEGTENVVFAVSKNSSYGIALLKTERKQMKPILAYISDDISEKDFHDLIAEYTSFRGLFCPVDFFAYL